MCRPFPGLPCAHHARAELRRARDQQRRAEDDVARAQEALSVAPDGADGAAVRVEAHASRSRLRQARWQVRQRQSDYDLTPEGLVALRGRADAAAGTPDGPRHAARAVRAQAVAARRDDLWRSSSAYVVEQLSAAAAARVPHLLAELGRRRCVEHAVDEPPAHPKARAVWAAHDAAGRAWAALVGHVGEAQAGATFMLQDVQAAAGGHVEELEVSCPLLSAHYRHLPAALIAADDLTAVTHREAAFGRTVDLAPGDLVSAARARGRPVVDVAGAAAAGGQPGDRWKVLALAGAVRVQAASSWVETGPGWACVRERDETLRILSTLTGFDVQGSAQDVQEAVEQL